MFKTTDKRADPHQSNHDNGDADFPVHLKMMEHCPYACDKRSAISEKRDDTDDSPTACPYGSKKYFHHNNPLMHDRAFIFSCSLPSNFSLGNNGAEYWSDPGSRKHL
jgi:hypothetical protein